ncbi:MAG: hypothetical protein QOJ22_1383 [Thermoleophilaceae bacterium]|nr:hypothetical protein [Thermoleophilaceae bacterium]
MTRVPAPTTVVYAACAVLALLVAAHLATDLKLFDLLEESNLPTWFSQAQFLLAAGACTAAALQDQRARTAWLLLAAVMTFFSLDEVAMIHERLEDHASVELALLVVEPLLGLALVAVVYTALRGRVDRGVLLLLGAAVLSLVLAQAASAINGVAEPTGFVYDLLAILEEVFEVLSGSFVLAAALARLSKDG